MGSGDASEIKAKTGNPTRVIAKAATRGFRHVRARLDTLGNPARLYLRAPCSAPRRPRDHLDAPRKERRRRAISRRAMAVRSRSRGYGTIGAGSIAATTFRTRRSSSARRIDGCGAFTTACQSFSIGATPARGCWEKAPARFCARLRMTPCESGSFRRA